MSRLKRVEMQALALIADRIAMFGKDWRIGCSIKIPKGFKDPFEASGRNYPEEPKVADGIECERCGETTQADALKLWEKSIYLCPECWEAYRIACARPRQTDKRMKWEDAVAATKEGVR